MQLMFIHNFKIFAVGALNDFKIKGFIKFSFIRCLCPSWSRDLSHYIACEESSRNQYEFSAWASKQN